MALNVAQLTIEINSKGEAVIKQVTQSLDELTRKATESTGGQISLLKTLENHWVKTAAAIGGAWLAVSKGMEFIELGAKARQAEESFAMVAASSGIAANTLISNLKRAAAGTVDDSDIMQRAVKGMILGLNDTQLVTIMENARVAARYAGTDVKTAFEDITNAIGTDMPRALKQYGLITREETAQVQAALKAGVTDLTLYDIAMAHAAVNTAKFGEAQANAYEGIQRLWTIISEVKEDTGKIGLDIFTRLYAEALNLDAFATRAAAGLMNLLGREDDYKQLLDASNGMLKDRRAILGELTEEERRAAEAAKMQAAADLVVSEIRLKGTQTRLADAAERAREKETATKGRPDGYGQQAEAELKFQEEVNALSLKYYKDQEKASEDTAKKVAENYTEAAQSELKFQEEINTLVIQYYKDQEAQAETTAKKRTDEAEKASQEILRIEEEEQKVNREAWEVYWKFKKEETDKADKDWRDSMFNMRGVTEDAFRGVNSSISSSIHGVIQGTQTMEQAFKNMGQSIMLGLIDSVVNRGLRAVQNSLLDSVFGTTSGGGGSTGGGIYGMASSAISGVETVGSWISTALSYLGALDTGMWKVPAGGGTFSGTKSGWGGAVSTPASGWAVLHPGEMVVPPDIAELLRRVVTLSGGSDFSGLEDLLTGGGGGTGARGASPGGYGSMTESERSTLGDMTVGARGMGMVGGVLGGLTGIAGLGAFGAAGFYGGMALAGILGLDTALGQRATGWAGLSEMDVQGIRDTYGYDSLQEAAARAADAMGLANATIGRDTSAQAAAQQANEATEAQEASQRANASDFDASNTQGPGQGQGPGGTEGSDTADGGHGTAGDGSMNAMGTLFRTRGRTRMTVGEAGSETVAVLRNPRDVEAGGGNTVVINLYNSGVIGQQLPDNLMRAIQSEIQRRDNRKVIY